MCFVDKGTLLSYLSRKSRTTIPTNELDMHPYVNTRRGPAQKISCPEAKNDRRMLICQHRQWHTLEQLTTLESSSIASAPPKNGVFTPKKAAGPYSSVRPHLVNSVNGTNTPHRLRSLAGYFSGFRE